MADNDATIVAGRTRTYVPHYIQIVSEHYRQFTSAMADSEALTVAGQQVPDELRYLEFSGGQIVIVFTWMTLEALAYDYAAMHFSDTYVRKHLERLPTLSKLLLIPQLITSRPFPTDGQAYQYLDELKTSRNNLVHYQSGSVAMTDEDKARSEEQVARAVAEFPTRVHHAYRCVPLYAQTVVGMHAEKGHFIQYILEDCARMMQ